MILAREIALYVAGAFVIVGGAFGLLAAIGILRFPDVYTRLHAASKAGVLGLGVVFIAAILSAPDVWTALRALAGIAFLLLTSPVAAHLLANAAVRTGTKPISNTSNTELLPDVRNVVQPSRKL